MRVIALCVGGARDGELFSVDSEQRAVAPAEGEVGSYVRGGRPRPAAPEELAGFPGHDASSVYEFELDAEAVLPEPERRVIPPRDPPPP